MTEGDSTDGISDEDARRLVRSGGDLIQGGSARGELAFREEVDAIVERVHKEFGITYYGAVGVLKMIAHNLMHEAQCEGCEGCDEGDDE